MYTINKVCLIFICFSLLGSCDLLDSGEPPFSLPLEEAITNEASARDAVGGTYSQVRDRTFTEALQLFCTMGLTDGQRFSPNNPFLINEPEIDLDYVAEVYQGAYRVIQEANLLIERVETLSDEKLGGRAEKQNLLAQARFLRGLMHFYLLRSYGQFYDTSSELGISLALSPATDNSFIPRSSVSESYTAIKEDFDFTISNATWNLNYFANAEAARALKAKVLLYEGEYAEAATLAQNVINSTSRTFAQDYARNWGEIDLATEVLVFGHTSPEIFFAPYGNEDDELVQRLVADPRGSIYEELASAKDDPRAGVDKESNFVFFEGNFAFKPATQVHMRLPELYLIHSEAAARSGSGVDAQALSSLNTIRTREAVGLPPRTDISSKDELLEAIRLEKLFELYTEMGEEYFDLVRYEMEGDLVASDIKPTMTNKDFYILPIPYSLLKIKGATEVIEQNPGYPVTI